MAVPLLATVLGILLHPAQSALFATPLYPGQLAQVQEQLAAWNEPFTPIDRNVVVTADRRNALLLRLALAGIPHAHVADSAETLANVGVLTPQSVVDAQRRRGLSGDIERALRGLAGVRDARVIIAPARRAAFADESSSAATASVRLRTIAGLPLDPAEAAGIRRFVAASVPSLQAARVTLLDDRGRVFDTNNAESSTSASQLQGALQSALDRAFGSGTTIVRVDDERDSATREIATTTRAPLGAVPLRERRESERYHEGAKGYERVSSSGDRGLAQRVVRERDPAGRLRRRSVAVLVDRTRVRDIAAIRSLVAAAAGIDLRRGDRLVVAALPFAAAISPTHDGWWLAYGALVPLLPTLATLLALLLVARMLARPLRSFALLLLQALRSPTRSREFVGLLPAQLRGALGDEPAHAAAAVISALPAATIAAVLELYPPEERAAILRNMARTRSPLVPNAKEYFERG
ncbi:MAG TPA: flagellar M-ring protein FliF C-terminal domain-containing protein [Candidatus Dormibacteraeota bacterium]|nr:flagellar M-ring protein FliF C-terminal domain-containing protein [Candidatus Dormibacteraeota bacterium]